MRAMLYALLAVALAPAQSAAQECAWVTDSKPRILGERKSDSGRERWLIRVDSERLLEATADAKTPRLDQYRNRAKLRFDTDPHSLMRLTRDAYAARNYEEVVTIIDLVSSGKVGRIAETDCLETLLLEEHLAFQRELTRGTEFRAIILRRPKPAAAGELKIYLLLGEIEGSAPNAPALKSWLRKDISEGWSLEIDLHNHPFAFHENAITPGAAIVPSAPDQGTLFREAEELGLKEGRITNGFHTVRIPAVDFTSFPSR